MGNYYLTSKGYPSTLSPKGVALLKALETQSPKALRETMEALFKKFTPAARSATLQLLLSTLCTVEPETILNEMGALSDGAIEQGLATLRYGTRTADSNSNLITDIARSTVATLAGRVEAEIYRELIEEMRSIRPPQTGHDAIYSTSPTPSRLPRISAPMVNSNVLADSISRGTHTDRQP